jgi:hypothetical protein
MLRARDPVQPRERLHEPGTFVGSITPTVRTSRWRAGPTSFGPVGRIVSTLVLAALFPWWGIAGLNPLALWAMMGWLIGAAIVLRSIWKPERIVDHGPSRGDRFRSHHPVLGAHVRLGRPAAIVIGSSSRARPWPGGSPSTDPAATSGPWS